MADKRTYIRVHDGMDEHPKIEPLSDKAFRVLMSTWFWCSRNKTDGLVSAASWAKRGTAKAREQLEVALVHGHGHTCPTCRPVPAGYVRIHDYLDHQRSAEEIAEAAEKKAAGGRIGNHRRWHVDGVIDPECEFCPPLAPTEPDPPESSHDRSDMRSDDRSQNHRFGSPEDRVQRTNEDSLRSSSGPRKRGRRLPDDFAVTPEMISWAREHTPLVGRAETDRFVDHWTAQPGQRGVKLDWIATWRNWMRRAQDDAERRHRPAPSPASGSRRLDKAMAALAPDDPLLAQLRGDTNTHLTVIEGGQTA